MPQRILAIQIQQPGDAILTTPALRYLINQGHHVHLLAQPIAASLLSTMPGLQSVESIHRGTLNLLRDSTRAIRYLLHPFDQTYIFTQSNTRNLLWALLSRSPTKVAPYRPNLPHYIPQKKFTWITKLPPHYHEVEQHLLIVGAPLTAASTLCLEYHPPLTDIKFAHNLLKQHSIPPHTHLHIHLTARWPSKCWPKEHYVHFLHTLTTRFPIPVFLTSGPAKEEIQYANAIRRHFPKIPAALGSLTPNQLGALIASSRAFFGMDSMPMHLAAALQIPGVTLFGMTNPNNFGPWRAPIQTLFSPCHCSITQQRTCPRSSNTDCLKAITPDAALQATLHAYHTLPTSTPRPTPPSPATLP